MPIVRVKLKPLTTFRSVCFACTDAGSSVRQDAAPRNLFWFGSGVGYLPPFGKTWHEKCSAERMARRVLVIDDVSDILMLATLSLEASGYVALTAHDGVEGLEMAASSWPDLILCDVHMPRLDGYGVLSAIRANAATADIPFVFVTGDESVSAHARQLPNPPDACLSKPFTHSDLVKTVNANINLHGDR